ncbi:MAG TPA: flagellar hook-associated protein FlgK [Stenomitos sp.]
MDYSLFGLGAAVRGMAAAQAALNTIGNNLANANTDGYSRQRVDIQPVPSVSLVSFNTPVSLAQLGGGVGVQQITRVRDDFLDLRIYQENATFGNNDTLYKQIQQIEQTFQEPSDQGLASVMTKFFNSWDQLATNPESSAARSEVRSQGLALANTMNELNRSLTRMRAEEDSQIQRAASDINAYSDQISSLNQLILQSTVQGVTPNNLMDQRDLAIQNLSKIVNIQTQKTDDGKILVFMKGRALVDADRASKLTVQPNAEGSYSDVVYRGQVVDPREMGGQLGALFKVRDEVIGRNAAAARPTSPALPDTKQGLLYQLDVLANELAQKVNGYHKTGTDLNGNQTGIGFFVNNNPLASDPTFIGLGGLMVDPNIQADVPPGLNRIVAGRGVNGSWPATSPGPGDNTIAQEIASVRGETADVVRSPEFGATETLNDYYRRFLSNLGVVGQAAERNATNQTNLIDHLQSQRESVSGVNFDQEMSDMVRYQHAYNASAKVISMFDQMLDRLINGVAPGR